MADNIGYTPGSGAVVAADEINGVLFQRIKPTFGEDGSAVDVSTKNPLPTVAEETLLLRRIVKLLESNAVVDIANRQRVTLDSIAAGTTLPTVTTVAAVTAITNALPTGTNTVGNVTVGGLDHRQFIDTSRIAYATNIRNRLTFS